MYCISTLGATDLFKHSQMLYIFATYSLSLIRDLINLPRVHDHVCMCYDSPSCTVKCSGMVGFVQTVITRKRVRRVGKERWVDPPIVKRLWVALPTSLTAGLEHSHYHIILLYSSCSWIVFALSLVVFCLFVFIDII